ncbi:MAG: DsbE family thiol:disulfide interchange protein, partial [Lysobacterales bacterium]
GKPAPRFTLPNLLLPDQRVTETSLRGEVMLVNVWASWCVTCRDEHELLKQAAESGIKILGLNYKDERADALRWLQTLGNPYATIAFDFDGKTGIDWGVYKVPESFVVDKRGVVRYKHLGAITAKDWQGRLLPLIEQLRTES